MIKIIILFEEIPVEVNYMFNIIIKRYIFDNKVLVSNEVRESKCLVPTSYAQVHRSKVYRGMSILKSPETR